MIIVNFLSLPLSLNLLVELWQQLEILYFQFDRFLKSIDSSIVWHNTDNSHCGTFSFDYNRLAGLQNYSFLIYKTG